MVAPERDSTRYIKLIGSVEAHTLI